jgi:hypothetical protein
VALDALHVDLAQRGEIAARQMTTDRPRPSPVPLGARWPRDEFESKTRSAALSGES